MHKKIFTGMINYLNDQSLMPFGKYIGKPMANVPAIYLLWLFDNGCTHNAVRVYISENIEALRKEAGRIKK